MIFSILGPWRQRHRNAQWHVPVALRGKPISRFVFPDHARPPAFEAMLVRMPAWFDEKSLVLRVSEVPVPRRR